MTKLEPDSFSPDLALKLTTYVYRLIDPRNGETFYVGKGNGNRVFAHIRSEENLDGDEIDNKLKRIREIRLAEFEVGHVIHRHGMDDATAFEVEAALMDAYPGLTNIAGGTGGNDYGVMHAREIIRRYSAEPAVFQHRALLITVNRSAAERSLYDATRYAWKIDKSKAKQAHVILSVVQGVIVGAFVAHEWLEASAANFPGRTEFDGVAGRWGFVGEEAPDDVKKLMSASGCRTSIESVAPRIRSSTPGEGRPSSGADESNEPRVSAAPLAADPQAVSPMPTTDTVLSPGTASGVY